MTKKKRSGSSWISKKTGKQIVRKDHEYTQTRFAAKEDTPHKVVNRKEVASALEQKATLVETPSIEQLERDRPDFSPRFNILGSVFEKPAYLETEIGRIDFTEDMISGFEERKPPRSKRELWAIAEEAAERYARVTAFMAADQNVTIEEIISRPDSYGNQKNKIHPTQVLEALQRKQVQRGDIEVGDGERVWWALEGTTPEEDNQLLLEAATLYESYLRANAPEFLEGDSPSVRDVDTKIWETVRILRDYENGKVIFKHPNPFSGNSGSVERIRSMVHQDGLDYLRSIHGGHPDKPFVEYLPNGLRVNLTEDKTLDFIAYYKRDNSPAYDDRWYYCIKRWAVDPDTKEPTLVGVDPSGIRSYFGTVEDKQKAYNHWADFDKPINQEGKQKKPKSFRERTLDR